jgi:peptide/nickel transport system substrate-binding protein
MKKLLPIGMAGALLILLVAACGGGSSGGGGTISVAKEEGKTANAACEEEPVAGGSLVYDRTLEVVSLNPREQKNGNGDIVAAEMLFNGLTRNDPTGAPKVVPALAESWTISPNRKTYTFHLRKGLKYSDGSTIAASEVAWNIEQFHNPEVNTLAYQLSVGIEDAKAPNPTTVVVNLEHPVAAVLYSLAVFPAFIIDQKKYEAEGEAYWKHPVGTGPFRLKEFASGSHITFERNPYYFEKGKPYLQTMRWNFVADPNTRILNLKNGEAQLADTIPFSQVEALQGESAIAVQQINLPNEALMVLNNKMPEFSDPHVRRAVSLALNREQLNEVVFRGTGSVPNSMFPPFALDASEQEIPRYENNVEKAKEELAKSKYPNGFSATLEVPANGEFFKQMTLLIQQNLEAVGIKVKITEAEPATIEEKWLEGKFDMIFPFTTTASDLPVPDEYVALFALKESGLDGFKSFWHSNEVEKQVNEFLSSTSESARQGEWKALQERFNEEMPSINVINFPFINAHQSNVCGTEVNAVGIDQMQETWISEASS